MTQTMPTTLPPGVTLTLSGDWSHPLTLVPLVQIIAGDTCEGRSLMNPDERQILRDDYTFVGLRDYDSWSAFLADLSRGLRFPVMWDSIRGVLGNGHHRVVGAYDLGWSHIPIVEWDSVDDCYVTESESWWDSGGE